jgi:prepilin-type N-terminal cleavage/methylation domain-containing protein
MKRFTRGFTLIELLVVIAIIGILASVVLVSLQSARKKGNDTRVISNVQQLRTQLESDFNGSKYPLTCVAAAPCVLTTAADGTIAAATGSWGAGASSNYATLAKDIYEQSGNSSVTIVVTPGASGAVTAYAISGKLPSYTAANTYFCIDSTGATKSSTTAAPNTVTCQ